MIPVDGVAVGETLVDEAALTGEPLPARRDGEEFMALAPQVPVRTEVEVFPLLDANAALARLRSGGVRGAVALSVAS